jgi:catechol 2,3-dioxygenase-like lactoylglutathione lyase family enzyme
MKKLLCIAACVAAAFVSGSVSAAATGIPGIRGVDHIGVTVPDIDQGVKFFSDVMGCKEAFRFGPLMDDKGTFMQDLVNVNPRAEIKQIVMLRCGQGSNSTARPTRKPSSRATATTADTISRSM